MNHRMWMYSDSDIENLKASEKECCYTCLPK